MCHNSISGSPQALLPEKVLSFPPQRRLRRGRIPSGTCRSPMHTHHSHSGSYCRHAKDTLESVLQRFDQLQFHTVGLSEHCPREQEASLYPEEKEVGLTPNQLVDTFRAFVRRARELQSHYAPRLNVLVGAETEHLGSLTFLMEQLALLPGAVPLPDGATSATASAREGASSTSLVPLGAHVGKGAIDYLVGSVHHVRGTPIDFDPPTFDLALRSFRGEGSAEGQAESPNDNNALAHAYLMTEYFDAQYEVLRVLRPEVIGHMDLCRLYSPHMPVRPSAADSSQTNPATGEQMGQAGSLNAALFRVWAKVQRNVRYAAAYGALFEINSSALRKGWKTAYPGPEILQLIQQVGGRVCLSDDSHGVAQVGLNYARARDYLMQNNVDRIWVLTRPPLDAGPDQRHAPPVSEPDYAAHAEDTVQARARGQDHSPAPTQFPRGLEARPLEAWAHDPFWGQELPSTLAA